MFKHSIFYIKPKTVSEQPLGGTHFCFKIVIGQFSLTVDSCNEQEARKIDP